MKILSVVTALFITVNAYADTIKGKDMEVATLGGGCFWCVEAIYEMVEGVEKVESGYSGGKDANPSYDDVSGGDSGHAEVVQITFDPAKLSFSDVLTIFFHTHDPTTLNQQGADRGTQYRSVIYYHNEKQKAESEAMIKKITEEKLWPKPIVTEVSPFSAFYKAEDYHQNYYKNNQSQPYCSLVIGPKIQKLKKEFADKLKK